MDKTYINLRLVRFCGHRFLLFWSTKKSCLMFALVTLFYDHKIIYRKIGTTGIIVMRAKLGQIERL